MLIEASTPRPDLRRLAVVGAMLRIKVGLHEITAFSCFHRRFSFVFGWQCKIVETHDISALSCFHVCMRVFGWQCRIVKTLEELRG